MCPNWRRRAGGRSRWRRRCRKRSSSSRRGAATIATLRARRPAAELRDDRASSLERRRTLLVTNAELPFELMVSEHPLMGAANVPQILAFLARHERRHQSQIEKLKADPGYP